MRMVCALFVSFAHFILTTYTIKHFVRANYVLYYFFGFFLLKLCSIKAPLRTTLRGLGVG